MRPNAARGCNRFAKTGNVVSSAKTSAYTAAFAHVVASYRKPRTEVPAGLIFSVRYCVTAQQINAPDKLHKIKRRVRRLIRSIRTAQRPSRNSARKPG